MTTPEENEIDFRNRPQDSIGHTLKAVTDMLLVAGKYNGRVFGGYVRDVIVPLLHSTCPVTFKDVDIWFTAEEDAKLFVEEMGVSLTELNAETHFKETGSVHLTGLRDDKHARWENGPVLYEFKRWFAILNRDELALSYVDIIINEEFPVDDFNVNCISVRYFKNDDVDTDMVCHGYELDKIIKAIENKTMTMKSAYLERLRERNSYINRDSVMFGRSGDSSRVALANQRLTGRYIKNGWKIFVPSIEGEGIKNLVPLQTTNGYSDIRFHLYI